MIRKGLLLMCFYTLNILAYPALMGQDHILAGPADTRVIYQADEKVFPCKWRNKKINPEINHIPRDEIPRMQKVLGKALGKYPAELLKKNLKGIYVFKTMFFLGLQYGGTYHKRKVYITNNGIENGYSNYYIEGTFHHEFSSVLMKRHTRYFKKEAWLETNPPGFAYGKGGVEALRTEETNLKLDSNLFETGFLNEYSQASIEEDFNCYAEYLFLTDPDFWVAWENNEAIRRKTAILIRFYQRIDPIFTLEYFREL